MLCSLFTISKEYHAFGTPSFVRVIRIIIIRIVGTRSCSRKTKLASTACKQLASRLIENVSFSTLEFDAGLSLDHRDVGCGLAIGLRETLSIKLAGEVAGQRKNSLIRF